MPSHSEKSANTELGTILRSMLGSCDVLSEDYDSIMGRPLLMPDILITASDRAPVVIEAKFELPGDVEEKAMSRLGLRVVEGTRKIEAAIAMVYPKGVEDAYALAASVSDANLKYCVFTGTAENAERFPESGWLDGSVSDLADLAQLVSVPQEAVEQAATTLQSGIEEAVGVLDSMSNHKSGITEAIAGLLSLSDVPQTRRMACAIIANALVFHEQLAGMYHGRVKPIRLVCGDGVMNPQEDTLNAWAAILKINYWPIFSIARDILSQMPAEEATNLLRTLRNTAQGVVSTGVPNAHDLTGRIFQKLIADRKYLATFYTLPSSAALLARLAVAKLEEVDWSDAGAIGKLRVGDFACGTGALLSAVYDQIAARHERSGGDPAQLHTDMMEEVLYGCDVLPSAIHITGSTLSGMQPNVGFGKSRLYALAYGRQADGSVKIGSLDLLQSSSAMSLFNTSDPAMRTGSTGEETASQIVTDIMDGGFDLVIMNPPFTRATVHGGAHANVINPAVAAFDASASDQANMGMRIKKLGQNTCYHGNAGMASVFSALAHRKLKPGGILALVLPLAAAAGLSWQRFRQMLERDYTDLTVLTIANSGSDDLSFSSDTGMAECLVVARRRAARESRASSKVETRSHFVSLSHCPRSFVDAAQIANSVLKGEIRRGIEDGPYGGTSLMVGDELAGESITVPSSSGGAAWGAVRLSDHSVAQTAFALSLSKLWLPGESSSLEIKIASLGVVGKLGMVHRDITPPPRGPFVKVLYSPTATYPSLWNHNAENETRIVCVPDSQLRTEQGMEARAADVWTTASRAHLSLGFRFNSQPLSASITDQKTIGGTVWPNVIFSSGQYDFAFALWGNTTLGLVLYWWHSNRQHSGRGWITIRSAESLPVLDLRALTDEQLAIAEGIFDDFRDKELKPAFLADADPNRALLDRRVVCDLLGFDEDTYQAVRRLSAKWCAEPSVHGGKRRPKNAKLIM